MLRNCFSTSVSAARASSTSVDSTPSMIRTIDTGLVSSTALTAFSSDAPTFTVKSAAVKSFTGRPRESLTDADIWNGEAGACEPGSAFSGTSMTTAVAIVITRKSIGLRGYMTVTLGAAKATPYVSALNRRVAR